MKKQMLIGSILFWTTICIGLLIFVLACGDEAAKHGITKLSESDGTAALFFSGLGSGIFVGVVSKLLDYRFEYLKEIDKLTFLQKFLNDSDIEECDYKYD